MVRSNACPICGVAMERMVELPRFPLTEMYEPWTPDFLPGRGLIDQALLYCQPCGHGKLEAIVPPEVLYGSSYRTRTTGSDGARQAVENFAEFVIRHATMDSIDTVIDIGGNDGYLLNTFFGKRLVAVDPHASDEGAIREFIEDADLAQFKGHRKLILSSHTIEHLRDPGKMLAKVASILCHGDVVALQFPSLELMVEDARIDHIHHQHIHYFSERSISALLAQHDMEVMATQFDPSHYGALMVVARRGRGEVRGKVIDAGDIWTAEVQFKEMMESVHQPAEFMAAGASLMLPVLAYHLPWLGHAQVIYDGDESKHEQRYINFPVRISKDASLGGRDVVISGIATRQSARALVALACKEGARNVIVPLRQL